MRRSYEENPEWCSQDMGGYGFIMSIREHNICLWATMIEKKEYKKSCEFVKCDAKDKDCTSWKGNGLLDTGGGLSCESNRCASKLHQVSSKSYMVLVVHQLKEVMYSRLRVVRLIHSQRKIRSIQILSYSRVSLATHLTCT